MGERRRSGGDGFPSAEALERTLAALGPLLRRRARVGAPDPAFVRALRGHLLALEMTTPAPVHVRAPRRHDPPPAREPRGRGRRPRWRRVAVGIALAAALVVAWVVVAGALVGLVGLDLAVAVLAAVVLVAVLVGRRRP